MHTDWSHLRATNSQWCECRHYRCDLSYFSLTSLLAHSQPWEKEHTFFTLASVISMLQQLFTRVVRCTTRTHVDAMDDFCWVGGHGSLEAERMSSNTQAYVHTSLTRNAICQGCARFEHTYESMMPNPVSHCSPSSSLPASGEQMTLRARMVLILHH